MKVLLVIILAIIAKQASADAACYAGTDFSLCNTCGGTCDSMNGCNCANGFDTCVPTDCVLGSNHCCDMLSGWYYDPIKSCCTEEFQCTPPCTTDEICFNSSGVAECRCNSTYYNGRVVGDLKPSVNCSGGAMTTSISKCELEALGYDFSTVHLINSSDTCVFSYDDVKNKIRMNNVQVKAAIGWCGNIASMNEQLTIDFTNTLHIDAYNGPLITKNPLSYNITCQYNLTMQTSLSFALHPITSTITIPSASGISSFSVSLAAYTDQSCTVPIQDSDSVNVGTDIYLGLYAADLDADTFSLRVETCLATPVNNSNYETNVQLVKGGCPADGGVQAAIVKNGVSSEAIIKISAFLFQGYNDVFIFCSVQICNKSADCSKCNLGRALGKVYDGLGINLKIDDTNEILYSSSGRVTGVSWALLLSTLLAYLKSF